MILNNNPIYAKVWDKKVEEKYIDFRVTTAEKKEEERIYSTWFPRAIGHAYNSLKDINVGDNIVITRSKFANEPYTNTAGEKKSSFKFIILEANKSTITSTNTSSTPQKSTPTTNTPPTAPPTQQDNDLPW